MNLILLLSFQLVLTESKENHLTLCVIVCKKKQENKRGQLDHRENADL